MSYFAFEAEESSYEDEELEKELEARVSAFVISDLENDSDDESVDDDLSSCDEDKKSKNDEFDFSKQLVELSSYSNLTSVFFEDFNPKALEKNSIEIKEDKPVILAEETTSARKSPIPPVLAFLPEEKNVFSNTDKIQFEIDAEKKKNEREKAENEENAALKIQKAYRGFAVRKSKTGRMLRAHLESKKKILFVEKAQQFEFEERRRVAEEIKKENQKLLAEKTEREINLKRKELEKEKAEKALEAAKKAEAIWNERVLLFTEKSRRRVEHQAAVRIQERGFTRTVRCFLKKRFKCRSGAALVIQRNYRDYCTRKRTQAAVAIQTRWRKYRALKAKRARENNFNAIKLILTHRRQARQIGEAKRLVAKKNELRIFAARKAETEKNLLELRRHRSARIIQRMWRNHVITQNKAAEILEQPKMFTQVESQKTMVLRKSGISVNSPRADLPILGLANRENGLAENDASQNARTRNALETQNTIVVKKIDESLLVEFKNNLRRIRPVKCVQAASIDLPKTGNKRLLIERFEQTSFKNSNPFESVTAFDSPNLRVLDLSSSMLKSCNIELPNLRRLDLSKNRLRSRLLIKAPRLRVLNISENKFARLLFTPLPHLSVLDASCNQLIDVQNLSEIAPRVMFLNLAENFIDKAPARLSSLLHLDLTNNSLCNLDELSSPFLASLRAQFNNFKESDRLKVLPFIKKDSFLWADSPKEILALNVKTKEDMNADFDHGRLSTAVEQFDWSEIGITKKSLTLVDKSYWQLWHMRQYILQSDKHQYDPLPAIGSFLKSLIFKQRKLAKEKNAVEVIGAWWAAANVRLKIRRARKQIRAKNNAEYKLEEFDVDSFYESLNVEQELGDMEENLPAAPKVAAPQLQNQTRHHNDANFRTREFAQKQPLLTYYDVEGNTHSVMNAYDSLVDEEKIRSQAQELFAWKQMGDAPNSLIYADSFKSSRVSSSAPVLPSIPETIAPKITKKEEKILNIMQSWNVGRETAERMYLSNSRMKGKKTRKKESQKSSVSATNSVSYIQELNSMTSLASARSRDRTWIKPKYQSDSQRIVVNNWVQKIDEGMSVTPEPHDPAPFRVKSTEKSNSDHFSFAKSQLSPFSLRSSTPPLPPLKKKASHVPAWH